MHWSVSTEIKIFDQNVHNECSSQTFICSLFATVIFELGKKIHLMVLRREKSYQYSKLNDTSGFFLDRRTIWR